MDQDREDQLAMSSRTSAFLRVRVADIAASPNAAAQATVVTDMYATMAGARGGAAKRTKELSRAARTARKHVMAVLPGLLGPLTRVATKLGDTTVLASATLTQSQLRGYRPLPFLGVMEGILKMTAQPAIAAGLKDGYGLTVAKLQPVRDAVQAFRDAQPKPRRTIDERVRAGEKLEGLVDTLMQEIRDLDEDMKGFILLDAELYGDYLQARKIINTGSRGGDGGGEGEAPAG